MVMIEIEHKCEQRTDLSILHKVKSPVESLVEGRHAPGSNAFDRWIKRGRCQLKPDLVIALASGSVSNELRPFTTCHLNDALGDAGSSQRSAQQIAVLVNSSKDDGRKDEIINELSPSIVDECLRSSQLDSLSPDLFEVFFLTNVRLHQVAK